MKLQESGEMYLETILILSQRQKNVRSIDVCEEMGFSKPSVSRAVNLLKEGGFLSVDSNGSITLTHIGSELAKKIFDRHTTLTNYLIGIGVSTETASEDACRIEHVISDETMKAIRKQLKK